MTDGAGPWHRRLGVRYAALGLFVVYVFVLAATAISVSTVEARFGLAVWSDGRFVPGQTSGLRVAALDVGRGRHFEGFEARGRLESGDQVAELFQGQTPHAALAGTVRVPETFPTGPARLVVSARRGDLYDELVSEVTVGTGAAPPRAAPSKDARAEPEPRRVRVRARAAGGLLVPELTQRLIFQATTADGAPAAGERIEVELARGAMDGLPPAVNTDAAGLAAVRVQPHFHDLLLRVGPPGEPRQDLHLLGQPVQFVAHVGPVLVDPASPLDVLVDSMHGHGAVYADLWRGGRWVAAQSAALSGGEAHLRLPPLGGDSPAVLQVLRHFAAPGKARYVLALQPAGPGALGTLARMLRARGVEAKWIAALEARGLLSAPPDAELLAGWLLALWPDRPPEPPLLGESGARNTERVQAYRDQTKGRVLIALSATGILVLLSVTYVLVFHVLKLERRYRTIREEEDFRRLSRTRAGWEAALLLATLALAILGLIVLLAELRWA